MTRPERRRPRAVPRPVLLVIGAAAGLALGVVSLGYAAGVTTDPQVRNEVTDLPSTGSTDPAAGGVSTSAAGESTPVASPVGVDAPAADEPVVVDPAQQPATDQAVTADQPVPAEPVTGSVTEPVTEPVPPTALAGRPPAPAPAPEATPEPVICPDNWAGVGGVCVPPPTETNGG